MAALLRLRWILTLLLLSPLLAGEAQEKQVADSDIAIPLPVDFKLHEEGPKYRVMKRSLGIEAWAKIRVETRKLDGLLAQPVGASVPEDLLPLIPFLQNAKLSYQQQNWHEFSLGVYEYRRVEDNLPIVGYATILPFSPNSVGLLVSAPEPFEKEMKQEFLTALGAARGETAWIGAELRQKHQRATGVAQAGMGLLILYWIVWFLFFRGRPFLAHLLRTIWLSLVALLLFTPLTMPTESSFFTNLAMNLLGPLVILSFVIRRIKMAVEEGD